MPGKSRLQASRSWIARPLSLGSYRFFHDECGEAGSWRLSSSFDLHFLWCAISSLLKCSCWMDTFWHFNAVIWTVNFTGIQWSSFLKARERSSLISRSKLEVEWGLIVRQSPAAAPTGGEGKHGAHVEQENQKLRKGKCIRHAYICQTFHIKTTHSGVILFLEQLWFLPGGCPSIPCYFILNFNISTHIVLHEVNNVSLETRFCFHSFQR